MVRRAAVALVYAAIEQKISHVATEASDASAATLCFSWESALGADIETSASKQLQNMSRANEAANGN